MTDKILIEKMVDNSLLDEGQTREKLAKKLQLEKDGKGKYLSSFFKLVADENNISIDEAKDLIITSRKLSSFMFVLA